MNISTITLVLCIYVMLESLSVATETNGIVSYIKSLSKVAHVSPHDGLILRWFKLISAFVQRCSPFCIVLRYFFNFIAAAVIAWQCLDHMRHNILHLPTVFDWRYLLFAAALWLNCWGRMVYRIVGDRRAIREA